MRERARDRKEGVFGARADRAEFWCGFRAARPRQDLVNCPACASPSRARHYRKLRTLSFLGIAGSDTVRRQGTRRVSRRIRQLHAHRHACSETRGRGRVHDTSSPAQLRTCAVSVCIVWTLLSNTLIKYIPRSAGARAHITLRPTDQPNVRHL